MVALRKLDDEQTLALYITAPDYWNIILEDVITFRVI
jgi:hypothetical protein